MFGQQKVSRSQRSGKARVTSGNDPGQQKSSQFRHHPTSDACKDTRPDDAQTSFLKIIVILRNLLNAACFPTAFSLFKGSATSPTPMQEEMSCEADTTEEDGAVKSVSTIFHLAARLLTSSLPATWITTPINPRFCYRTLTVVAGLSGSRSDSRTKTASLRRQRP